MEKFFVNLGKPVIPDLLKSEVESFVDGVDESAMNMYHRGFYVYPDIYKNKPTFCQAAIDMFNLDLDISNVRMHVLHPNSNIALHIDSPESGRTASINFPLKENCSTTVFYDGVRNVYSFNYDDDMYMLNVLERHAVFNNNTQGVRWTVTVKLTHPYDELLALHKAGKLLRTK